jgi:hypothetical protein
MSEAIFWTQTIIAAGIAFGATFSGVFVSFDVERRRREREEMEHFAQILQSVRSEAAMTHGNLEAIKQLEGIHLIQLNTSALEAALRDPLFQYLAGHSLIYAAHMVKNMLDWMNNVLSIQRQAFLEDRTLSADNLALVKEGAGQVQKISSVLKELINEKLNEIGAEVLSDRRLQEIHGRVMEIFSKGDGDD